MPQYDGPGYDTKHARMSLANYNGQTFCVYTWDLLPLPPLYMKTEVEPKHEFMYSAVINNGNLNLLGTGMHTSWSMQTESILQMGLTK
jgi:hypothetical protein